MDLATLRTMRKNSFNKISSEMTKISNPSNSYTDERFWKLEGDKVGNGTAIIRFLPGLDADGLPWVRLFNHMFKGPTGRWYAEKSLTSIGLDDPVSELNSKLWNSGIESDKEIARRQKRQLQYIANILVVSDAKNPDNDGKVFLFKFGKKIFDKIKDKAQPTFADDDPVNVFDPFVGANFKLRMRKVEEYSNYDQSVFLEPSPIDDDEEAILAVLNKQHPLTEFSDPNSFKPYDELAKKLNDVLFPSGSAVPNAARALSETLDEAPEKQVSKAKVDVSPPWDDDDDAMAFFKKIAQED